jgi:hypothetical protein
MRVFTRSTQRVPLLLVIVAIGALVGAVVLADGQTTVGNDSGALVYHPTPSPAPVSAPVGPAVAAPVPGPTPHPVGDTADGGWLARWWPTILGGVAVLAFAAVVVLGVEGGVPRDGERRWQRRRPRRGRVARPVAARRQRRTQSVCRVRRGAPRSAATAATRQPSATREPLVVG